MPSTALFPRFIVVGFVGTRHIEDPAAGGTVAGREARLRLRLGQVLDQLQGPAAPNESLIAISSLAAGSDTVFAEVVADHQICHQVFLPQTSDEFFRLSDFGSDEALKRSESRLQGSNVIEVRVTSESPERSIRFSECGYEIANNCDVLVAVHSAGATNRPGGTLETLEYARTLGKRIIEVLLEGDIAVTGTAAKGDDGARLEHAELGRIFAIELSDRPEKEAYLPAVVALKRRTSSVSQRAKNFFQYSAGFVVTAHVLATVIAGAVVAYNYHHPWTAAVKIVLLGAGFGLPIYLHRRTPQREWATARLVAELCRSVLALRGFPERLTYLKAFDLPELEWLIQSMEIQHLQANAANKVELKAFVESYERIRIDVQIEFYENRVRQAKRMRHFLECMFYGFSGAALVGTIVYLLIQLKLLAPRSGMEELTIFIPIAFPVIAAASASLISTLDLDRRIERFHAMAQFLHAQRVCLRMAANKRIFIVRTVNRVEHALLQEVVEWFAKHAYVRGH